MSDGLGFGDPVTSGVFLLIPAIRSPNYSPGVSGWTINKDGSAEFNNLAIRGTFTGSNYVINTAGEFFYSGTPAAGNLIQSITQAAGTDAFGNAVLAGTTTYTNVGGTWFAVNLAGVALTFYLAAGPAGPYSQQADVRLTGTAGLGVLALDATGFIDITAPVDLTGQGLPNMRFASTWQTDTWHALTLTGSTVAGNDINGTLYPPAYMLGSDGGLRLRGVVSAGAGGLAAATTWAQITNPTYLPSTNVPVCLISNGTRGTLAHVYLRPNGNLQFDGALAGGVSMYLDCTLNIQGT